MDGGPQKTDSPLETTSRIVCELCDGLGEIAFAVVFRAVVEIPWHPGLTPLAVPALHADQELVGPARK